MTDNENNSSGFITDNSGSGFITEPQQNSYNEGSGFITETPHIAANGSNNSGNSTFPFSDISELSSQGAMSTVYKGKKYGKWYIIKRIKPQFKDNPQYRELFLKEFDNGILLDHPNIVRLEDKGEDENGLWYSMEYVDGRSLSDMIKNGQLKSDSLIKSITLQLCDALSYVHKKQIIHRDLKPDNILITMRGDNVKILDFGLAYADSYDDNLKTAGTPKYAAPEQMTKASQVDQRADIYALGLILQEMAIGKLGAEYVKDIQNPNFQLVVSKSIKQNPEERYHDCGEIMEDLRRTIVKLEEPIKQPEIVDTTPKINQQPEKVDNLQDEGKKSKLPILLIVAALVLAAVGTILFMNNNDNPKDNNTDNQQVVDNQSGKTEAQTVKDKDKDKDKDKENNKPTQPDPDMAAADKFFNDKNIPKAKQAYEDILKKNPNNSEAKAKIGQCQKILDEFNLYKAEPTIRDGNLGYVDENGNIIVSFEYDTPKASTFVNCQQLIVLRKHGFYGVIDNKTKLPVTDFKYAKVMGVTKKAWNGCYGWELYDVDETRNKITPRTKSDFIYADKNGNVVFIDHSKK